MRYTNKALGVVAVVVLLPLLYVLSLGPAFRLLTGDGIPPKVWETYHAPAWLIASHSDSFDQAIQRYIVLWMPVPTLKPLPGPYYLGDDVEYFPPGPEFPLSNEAAAKKAYKAEEEARLR